MIALGLLPPVLNGDPEIVVSAPVVELTVKAETVPASFAEKRNLPATVTRAAGPLLAVETALPTVVSKPVVALIEKTDIEPAVAFWKLATKANFGVVVAGVFVRGVKKSPHPVSATSSKAKLNFQNDWEFLYLMSARSIFEIADVIQQSWMYKVYQQCGCYEIGAGAGGKSGVAESGDGKKSEAAMLRRFCESLSTRMTCPPKRT
jgi:hypothetical protein